MPPQVIFLNSRSREIPGVREFARPFFKEKESGLTSVKILDQTLAEHSVGLTGGNTLLFSASNFCFEGNGWSTNGLAHLFLGAEIYLNMKMSSESYQHDLKDPILAVSFDSPVGMELQEVIMRQNMNMPLLVSHILHGLGEERRRHSVHGPRVDTLDIVGPKHAYIYRMGGETRGAFLEIPLTVYHHNVENGVKLSLKPNSPTVLYAYGEMEIEVRDNTDRRIRKLKALNGIAVLLEPYALAVIYAQGTGSIFEMNLHDPAKAPYPYSMLDPTSVLTRCSPV